MRRLPLGEHLDGLPICTAVAVRLVKLGECSSADVAWLRTVGARWHLQDGSLSLPERDHAQCAPDPTAGARAFATNSSNDARA